MAVAFQSASTVAFQTGSADCVIPKPSGLVVGDLMVAHVFASDGNQDMTPPTDWVEFRDDTIDDAGQVSHSYLFWKVADSDDAAATDFTFTSTQSGQVLGGAMLRIDGQHATSPIHSHAGDTANDDATPTFTNTITPAANSLLLFFASAQRTNTTTADYAITTSNPTWTERYDFNGSLANNETMSCATALRPESTATGDSSCSYAAGVAETDAAGQIVAIAPRVDVSPEAPLYTMTLYLHTTALMHSLLNMTVSLLSAAGHKWSAAGKASSSASNTSKTAASASSVSKSAAPTWDNTDKTP